jgi:hypothetical protein
VDLSGVSRAALLNMVEGVARNATRAKTAFQISVSDAGLMTRWSSGMVNLTSKLFLAPVNLGAGSRVVFVLRQ